MATVYRLFDLDFDVYVLQDTVIDILSGDTEASSRVMLDVLLAKIGFWSCFSRRGTGGIASIMK
jgi:hypothetical protein